MANNFSFNEYLVIDTTGSVGIGSTNPQARFFVTGSSTVTNQTAVLFRAGTASQTGGVGLLDVQNSTGTSLFFVSGSGNVGIGNSTPGAFFTVGSSTRANNTYVSISATAGAQSALAFDSGANQRWVIYRPGSSDDLRIYDATGGRDMMVFTNTTSNVGIGATSTVSARLQVSGSATASTPTMLVREGVVSPTGGALAFEVEKSAGSTILSVSGSGFVGIGTAIPTSTFEVVGVSGSLFSVTDSLSGSLFSVNTISGLPILEVFSDNTLIAGAYNSNALVVTGSNVGVGVRAPSVRFQVSGSSISAVPTSLFKAGVGSPTGAILDVQQSDGTSLLYVSGSSSTNYVTAYGVSQTSPSNTAGIFRVLSSATNALIMGALTNSPFATYIQSGGGNQYPLSLNPLGGNVGVGVTNPSYLLDVNGQIRASALVDLQNTSYLVDPASTSVLNLVNATGFYDADGGNARRFVNPGGGSLTGTTSTQTGALKIRFPSSRNNSSTMIILTIKIYEYVTGRTQEYRIGGYNYALSNWYNVFAYNLTDSGPNYSIRFGYDGTSDCIWIGETTSTWTYPQAYITEVLTGYSGFSADWSNGWSMSWITTFDTVEQGPFTPNRFWGNNNDGSGSGLDADLLDGYHASSFGLGTGTQNYVVKWTSTGNALGNSQIYDDATNVGVGTATMHAPLTVYKLGTGNVEVLSLKTTYPTDSTYKAITWRDSSNITGQIDTRYNGTTVDMVFGSLYNSGYNSTEVMRITGAGRVGIGTNDPKNKVHILGSSNDTVSRANANLTVEGAGGNGIVVGTLSSSPYSTWLQSGFVSNFGTATYSISLNPLGGNVGIGMTNPDRVLVVRGGNPTIGIYNTTAGGSNLTIDAPTSTVPGQIDVAGAFALRFNTNSAEAMRIDSSQNVGIGTATAGTRLHVYSGATDEVTRFESTGNPYISLYDTGVRQGYLYSNTSSVELVAENSKPLYLQGATEIRLRTNTTTDRVIINSGGVVGINYTPPVTTAVTKLMVSGDIGMPKANAALLGNLYYDTAVPGWKYGANGYGWGFREDNAGLLQMVRAGNNTSGANAAASISLTDLFTFDLVNNRVGLGTGSPSTKFHVLHSSNDPVMIEQTTDAAWNRIYFKKPTRSWTLGPDNSTGTNNLFVLADETAGAYRVTVDTSGNVGINTSSMSRKLVVHGSDALINDITIGRGGLSPSATSVTNTVLGNSTFGQATSSQTGNVAIGYLALNNATTGADGNVAMGALALNANTTAKGNVGIGYYAMSTITTASGSVAVGYEALKLATGADNTAVGWWAGKSISTATGNVAVGSNALATATTSGGSTAVGAFALYNNTSPYNTAVGYGAGVTVSTGLYNTSLGAFAGGSISSQSNSTAVGYSALVNATGAGNSAFGYNAGSAITSSTKNLILGGYTGNAGGLDIRTSTASINSNNIILSDGDGNIRARFDFRGAVGVGTTTAVDGYAMHVVTGSTNANTRMLVQSTGTEKAAGYWTWSRTADFGYFEGDSNGNFKIGSFTSNRLDLVTNNTVALTVDTSQNVGIGTVSTGGEALRVYRSSGCTLGIYSNTSNATLGVSGYQTTTPVTAALEVSSTAASVGTATSHPLRIVTVSGERMRIDTTGKVGIGTTNPSATLSVMCGTTQARINAVYTDYAGIFLNGSTTDNDYNFLSNASGSDKNLYINRPDGWDIRFRKNNGDQVTITSAGRVGIGTATPDLGFLHVNGVITNAVLAFSFGWLRNQATASGRDTFTFGTTVNCSIYGSDRIITGTEFNALSDYRTKNVQRNIESEEGLRFIEQVNPVIYTWKSDERKELKYGFIAQDVLKAGFGPLVGIQADEKIEEYTDEEGFTSPKGGRFIMCYDNIVPLLSAAMRGLKQENDSLKSEIQSLKDQISSILEMLNNK